MGVLSEFEAFLSICDLKSEQNRPFFSIILKKNSSQSKKGSKKGPFHREIGDNGVEKSILLTFGVTNAQKRLKFA